jgi:hypothetical protein
MSTNEGNGWRRATAGEECERLKGELVQLQRALSFKNDVIDSIENQLGIAPDSVDKTIGGEIEKLLALRARLAEAENPVTREQSVRCFKGEKPLEYWAYSADGKSSRYFRPEYEWANKAAAHGMAYIATYDGVSEIPYAELLAELEASWPEGAKELRRLKGELIEVTNHESEV